MIDDIDSNGTKADDKPKHMPAKPGGMSNGYAVAMAANELRQRHLHRTKTTVIKIDNVDDLEKYLADGTIEVKSMQLKGEDLVDLPTKLVVLDNANETQKDFIQHLQSMEQASMYPDGQRSATLNTFLPAMLGAAASFGQGNHSVSNVLGRQRLMITSEERQRRKKLKKIAARDRKRNRK